MEKYFSLFLIFTLASVNSYAVCEQGVGNYKTIFSKPSLSTNRIYFRAGTYNLYLDTYQVLNYLNSVSEKGYKNLASEITKDLLLNKYLDIYKYSLRNQENTNFGENIIITDWLIYEMLNNGYFKIEQMNRSGTTLLRIRVQDNSGMVQFCSVPVDNFPGEPLYFHLNYIE